MHRKNTKLLTRLTAFLFYLLVLTSSIQGNPIEWKELPALPDPFGFAGPFAGIVDGNLVVAGGANFPDGRPWEGANKIWHDTIYLLDNPDSEWKIAGTLPKPLAYGISITTPDGLICIGGSDSENCHNDVFIIQLQDEELIIANLAPLPVPLANASGVLIGDQIHVFGGTMAPAGSPVSRLWVMDLSVKEPMERHGVSLSFSHGRTQSPSANRAFV